MGAQLREDVHQEDTACTDANAAENRFRRSNRRLTGKRRSDAARRRVDTCSVAALGMSTADKTGACEHGALTGVGLPAPYAWPCSWCRELAWTCLKHWSILAHATCAFGAGDAGPPIRAQIVRRNGHQQGGEAGLDRRGADAPRRRAIRRVLRLWSLYRNRTPAAAARHTFLFALRTSTPVRFAY